MAPERSRLQAGTLLMRGWLSQVLLCSLWHTAVALTSVPSGTIVTLHGAWHFMHGQSNCSKQLSNTMYLGSSCRGAVEVELLKKLSSQEASYVVSAGSSGTGLEHMPGLSKEISASRNGWLVGQYDGATRSVAKSSHAGISTAAGTGTCFVAAGAGSLMMAGAALVHGRTAGGSHGSVCVSFDCLMDKFTCVPLFSY
uniref:Putative secreted protein n=1 Tax=Ixodes ricinus TaxID=34613 RepID=A0A6B0V1Z4_IXORI